MNICLSVKLKQEAGIAEHAVKISYINCILSDVDV